MSPRAVITGVTGFLGSHLAERLLDDGVDVLGLDNFLTGPPDNVARLAGHDGFRLIRADVTDFIHVVGAVDYVLHFASPASPISVVRLLGSGHPGPMNLDDGLKATIAWFREHPELVSDNAP
jgi:nucleoside-diphosphate-sugar epimerase